MSKRLYETPEELLAVFEAYCKKTAKETIAVNSKKTRYKGSDGEKSEAVQVPKPLTMYGFQIYSGIYRLRKFMQEPCRQTEEWQDAFEFIDNTIKECQVTGSMVGLYNPYLTARLNGISDKQEITTNEQVIKLSLGGDSN